MSGFGDFLQRFAEAGLDDDIDALASMILFPLVFYANGLPHLFPDRQRLADRNAARRGALHAAGVVAIDVNVAARSATRGPRHSVWTNTRYLDSGSRALGVSAARVYLDVDRDGPRVAMIELRRPAVPQALAALCRPAPRPARANGRPRSLGRCQ